jgi:peroxiredoxin
MLPVRVVLYFYQGCSDVLEDRVNTDRLDAAQHRAFRDHKPDLDARDYRAIGISSQTSRLQGESALLHDIPHLLLSDPELLVADALELPTFEKDGGPWYERLTLVVGLGRVQKAFFPVANAARSAAQVIAWMQIQGI